MARQEGSLQFKGTIGNLTFYKSQDGFMVKAKSSVSADKIAKSPNYQRTRENMAEFSTAGKSASLLRKAYVSLIARAKDGRLTSRLTSTMYKALQADATSERGQRNVTEGDLALLTGLDFNTRANMTSTMSAPYTATIDRASGDVTITIPAFVPANLVKAPQGATHFQLFVGAAAVDFDSATYEVSTAASENLILNNTSTAIILLKATVPANSALPLFLAFGIEFFQQMNGKTYSLNNGEYNACSIIKVDTSA
jgi:hypothetical protein